MTASSMNKLDTVVLFQRSLSTR